MMIHRKTSVPFYQFENLANYMEIGHFVSTRADGTHPAPQSSFNLSFGNGHDKETVQKNRRALSSVLGIPSTHIMTVNQVHGARIKIVSRSGDDQPRRPNDRASKSDAMITDKPGVCVMVLTADCVPILLYDPMRQVVGVVHAGWKGTLRSIVRKTVEEFEDNFESAPEDIIAGIGPSIGPCCFEVGPEVSQQFAETHGRDHVVVGKNGKKDKIDLWAANARQLMESGVPESHIEQADLCTCHHVDTFFSYRCGQDKTGRFGTGIFLK